VDDLKSKVLIRLAAMEFTEAYQVGFIEVIDLYYVFSWTTARCAEMGKAVMNMAITDGNFRTGAGGMTNTLSQFGRRFCCPETGRFNFPAGRYRRSANLLLMSCFRQRPIPLGSISACGTSGWLNCGLASSCGEAIRSAE
jgi:hypothetical protein